MSLDTLNVYAYVPYSQCYCEENTYRFLERFAVDPPKLAEADKGPARKYDLYVAFITSYSAAPGEEVAPGDWDSAVPIVSGPRVNDVVYWDYHCVSVIKETTPGAKGEEPSVKWWVVDYDTKLNKRPVMTPLPAELYFGVTLSAAAKNPVALLQARVRFMHASEFLSKFRSDRRHMYLRAVAKEERYKKMTPFQLDNPQNFQHPPPRFPRIQGASPAAGALKGEFPKAKGLELVRAALENKDGVENKHLNNLAEFLNTQNTTVCKSDLVGMKEIGAWLKAH